MIDEERSATGVPRSEFYSTIAIVFLFIFFVHLSAWPRQADYIAQGYHILLAVALMVMLYTYQARSKRDRVKCSATHEEKA